MEFNWTTTQLESIRKVEQFAESYFGEYSTPSGFDKKAWKACAEQGIFRLALPVDTWGGSNEGLLSTVAAFEAIGRNGADPGLMFSMGAHLFGCSLPIAKYAKPEIQNEWGKLLASGEAIGALTITEPAGGSNLQKLGTVATKNGDSFVINGEKTMITNAPFADVFLILTTTDPGGGIFGMTAFLVPKGTAGLSVTPLDNTCGLKGSPMGRVHLDNCKVTDKNILGSVNSGFHIFTKAMLWERSCLLSGFLGTTQRDIENCIQFINTRHDDQGPLSVHQSISHPIAKMQVRTEAARMLLYRAAWSVENGHKDANTKASMAKYYVSETLVKNAMDITRIQAGSGWSYQTALADILQNNIGTLFASGTSEIQLNIIAAASGLKRR